MCVLTGHGLKDPTTAIDRAPRRVPLRADDRRARGGGAAASEPPPAWCACRRPRPTSGPGYDCLAAALSLHLELEVEETGEFAVETDISRHPARPLEPVRAGVREAAPGRRPDVPDQVGDPAGGRPRLERRGDRRRPRRPPTTCSSSTRRSIRTRVEIEGHPDNVAAALLGGFVICTPDGARALRAAAGPRGRDRHPARAGAHRTRRARRCRPTVPMADAVHNIAHAVAAGAGPREDDFSLIGARPADRIHQHRRAHLYPRSMELVRQRASWAVGATISEQARRSCSGATGSRPAASSRRCSRARATATSAACSSCRAART